MHHFSEENKSNIDNYKDKNDIIIVIMLMVNVIIFCHALPKKNTYI